MIGPHYWTESGSFKVQVEQRDINDKQMHTFAGQVIIECLPDDCWILVEGDNIGLTIQVEDHTMTFRQNVVQFVEKGNSMLTSLEFESSLEFNLFVTQLKSLYHTEEDLEQPTLDNLKSFLTFMTQNLDLFLQFFYANSEQYLDNLCLTFLELEKQIDLKNLQLVFQIAKALILSNQEDIIEMVTDDKYYAHFLGMFYYHPDNALEKKNFRDIYANQTNFRQVFEIADENTLFYIHQNYKISFINDVVLASYLQSDEVSGTMITQTIMRNNTRIIKGLLLQEFQGLTQMLSCITNDTDQKANFLSDLIDVSKHLVFREEFRSNFIKVCTQSKMLLSLLQAMQEPLTTQRSLTTFVSMFILTLQSDPQFFLDFVKRQTQIWTIMSAMMMTASDPSLLLEVDSLVIKIFGYANSLDCQKEFIEIFKLDFLVPLHHKAIQQYNQLDEECQLLNIYLDLLCNLYQYGPSSVRAFVIYHKVLRQITETIHIKPNSIKCTIVRFYTNMLLLDDDLLIKHFKTQDICKTIAQLFRRYNKGMIRGCLNNLLKVLHSRETLIKIRDQLVKTLQDLTNPPPIVTQLELEPVIHKKVKTENF